MSSKSLPLNEEERKWFTQCNMQALMGALPPAIVFGVTAARWTPPSPNPLVKVAVGVGVGAAVFGGMVHLGKQTCIRDFASQPSVPTPVVLRASIRQREPDHWLVRQFDAKYPLHDENAVRNGATNMGVLPHFTPDAKLMELLLRKGDGTETKEQTQQQQAKGAKDSATHDVRRAASEAGAAAGSGARFAAPSYSSSDSMDPRSSSRQQPKQQQQQQQNGWRSDSDDTPARSTGEWGSSFGAQRKLKVRYNEFGDEIIEEQEMEKE